MHASQPQDLAGVHDVLRIERALERRAWCRARSWSGSAPARRSCRCRCRARPRSSPPCRGTRSLTARVMAGAYCCSVSRSMPFGAHEARSGCCRRRYGRAGRGGCWAGCSSAASMPLSMKRGIRRDRHRDVVAEAAAPRRARPRPRASRMRHMLRACASFWPITASSTRPASICVGEELLHLLRHALGAVAPWAATTTIRAAGNHGVSALQRILRAGDVAQHHVGGGAAHQLARADIVLRCAACASDRISMAACGSRMASQAVATSLGAGHSFSTALVMMPSVPSAPMNRCFRS